MDRTLVLLRHAKSAWPDGVPDHDRPLGPRGRRDAPWAGRWLRDNGHRPGRVICSTARRTRETWRLAAEALGEPPVTYDERLYAADPEDLLTVVAEQPADVETLLLVGHAPGIPGLASDLTGSDRLRTKFPTCAIAVLTVPAPWADVRPGGARLAAFVTVRRA